MTSFLKKGQSVLGDPTRQQFFISVEWYTVILFTNSRPLTRFRAFCKSRLRECKSHNCAESLVCVKKKNKHRDFWLSTIKNWIIDLLFLQTGRVKSGNQFFRRPSSEKQVSKEWQIVENVINNHPKVRHFQDFLVA